MFNFLLFITMPNVDDLLIHESGRISEDIHDRTLHTSVWLDLVKKDVWPDEMGEQISVLMYERSLPASSPTWNTVTFNDGGSNNCVPTAEQVEFAQTLRNYNLQQTALESPPICVNDLRFTFKRKKQLENCFSILAQNTSWLWQERHRDEYVRLSDHKVICTDAFPEGSASFPLTVPTSRLTGGILKRFYQKLVRDGAARDGGSVDMVNGRPQFIAVMSPEMDELVIMEDYKIREDMRALESAPALLAPLGVNRPYRGYFHLVDDFPPRHNFSGSWDKVEPYVPVATTQGNKYEVNPDYEDADYEDTIIYVPSVFKTLIPKAITTPGGNTQFDAQKYMGDWGWRNIEDRVENPDKNWGYFRGIFSSGSEPVFPQFGYVLRHLRADTPLEFVDANGNTPA